MLVVVLICKTHETRFSKHPNPGTKRNTSLPCPPLCLPAAGLTPALEVWCVEAEMSSANDTSVEAERLIWIVIRENENASWTAALLATMSSTWPYKACGVDL